MFMAYLLIARIPEITITRVDLREVDSNTSTVIFTVNVSISISLSMRLVGILSGESSCVYLKLHTLRIV